MKKCVVITSIHESTEIIKQLSEMEGFDLIIVGDSASPKGYEVNCKYIDVDSQKELFFNFSTTLSFNHYSRKNIGYLYAIRNGYDFIYDTDDDNIPLFDHTNFTITKYAVSPEKIVNIYRLFSEDTEIWPRGFPLSRLHRDQKIDLRDTPKSVSIVYGLCDGDTDVDAIYRLTHPPIDITFSGDPCAISNENIIVFNSQSTFWIDPEVFPCLYLPTTVSSRFSDILRSYITQYVLRPLDKHIGIYPHIAYQKRNAHNLYDDLREELFMYETTDAVIDILEGLPPRKNSADYLYEIYRTLLSHKIVQRTEIDAVNEWLALL